MALCSLEVGDVCQLPLPLVALLSELPLGLLCPQCQCSDLSLLMSSCRLSHLHVSPSFCVSKNVCIARACAPLLLMCGALVTDWSLPATSHLQASCHLVQLCCWHRGGQALLQAALEGPAAGQLCGHTGKALLQVCRERLCRQADSNAHHSWDCANKRQPCLQTGPAPCCACGTTERQGWREF